MKINLKDYYPSAYTTDHFIEVDEEIASAMRTVRQEIHAHKKRMRRNRVVSLEAHVKTNGETHEFGRFDDLDLLNIRAELLHALALLTAPQARRIYLHFYAGMSKAEIARCESVSASSVKDSIRIGLSAMKKLLE